MSSRSVPPFGFGLVLWGGADGLRAEDGGCDFGLSSQDGRIFGAEEPCRPEPSEGLANLLAH